jgi:hypothetical protein
VHQIWPVAPRHERRQADGMVMVEHGDGAGRGDNSRLKRAEELSLERGCLTLCRAVLAGATTRLLRKFPTACLAPTRAPGRSPLRTARSLLAIPIHLGHKG